MDTTERQVEQFTGRGRKTDRDWQKNTVSQTRQRRIDSCLDGLTQYEIKKERANTGGQKKDKQPQSRPKNTPEKQTDWQTSNQKEKQGTYGSDREKGEQTERQKDGRSNRRRNGEREIEAHNRVKIRSNHLDTVWLFSNAPIWNDFSQAIEITES